MKTRAPAVMVSLDVWLLLLQSAIDNQQWPALVFAPALCPRPKRRYL